MPDAGPAVGGDDAGNEPDPDAAPEPDDGPPPPPSVGPYGPDLHEIEPGRSVLDVAMRYAPIWYHDTDSGGPDGLGAAMDYPTSVDFDGDRIHSNNWEGLTTTVPWSFLYYALVSTDSHFFLTFSHYHPRDWEPICSGLFGECHEGDMETVRIVVRRTPSEEVIAVQSGAHGDAYYWATESDAVAGGEVDIEGLVDFESDSGSIQRQFDAQHTHVRIYAQERGHGPIPCRARETEPFFGYSGFGADGVRCAGGSGEPGFSGGSGIVFVPDTEPLPFDPAVAVGLAAGYGLLNVEATLWQWRAEIGSAGLWRDNGAFVYAGSRGGEFTISGTLGARFTSDQFINDSVTGEAPWRVSASGLATGDLFFDPAFAWAQLVELDHPVSLVYDYNPYVYSGDAVAP